MKKFNIKLFISEIDDKLVNKRLVTPLDMDILASKLVFIDNLEQMEFIESIFEKYRKTQPALFMRDSMHYGFIRSYFDLNQADRLLNLLTAKYKYGIFLDTYTANILMDFYLKEDNYRNASQVAVEAMLQEFTDNQLTHALSILSCLKYLSTLEKVKNVEVVENENTNDDQKVEKVLVDFLRNPYCDDHFDVKNFLHLTGKTLYFASKNLNIDSPFLNTIKTYGLVVFGKYLKAMDKLTELVNGNKKFYKFIIDELDEGIKELIERASEKDVTENKQISEAYDKLKKLDMSKCVINDKLDLLKEAESFLGKIESTQIDKDIKNQQILFEKWSNEQAIEFNKQRHSFNVEAKRLEILKRIDELERHEEILTYFDNEKRIKVKSFNKGFEPESPSRIPIPALEAEFDLLFLRHFKKGKHKRDYGKVKPLSNNKKFQIEALKKLYTEKKTDDTIANLIK